MVYFDFMMSYIDLMASASYIRTQPIANRPGLLDIVYRNEGYRFSLETAHTDERRKGSLKKSREHSHHVYHMVLYTEGRNHFQLDGRTTPSEPGTLVLTDPGRPHDFGPLARGRTSYHEMTFTFEHHSGPLMVTFPRLLSLYTGAEFEPVHFPRVLTSKQLNTMDGLYKNLLRYIDQSGTQGWFEAYRIVWSMLSFIITELFVPANRPEPADAGPLAQVKSYIDEYYATAILLADLARIAHYSEAHLCRTFKKNYGLSPIGYQQSLRVAAAKNLLASTNHPCKEIAQTLGYADPYAFSKAFKKITNTAPSHYRKKTAYVMEG